MDVTANYYFLVFQSVSSLKADENRRRSNLESLFCYDKAIPEEIIEKPVGLSLAEKAIGNNLRCTDCQAKGAVLCATCAGSGLYVDSILESQGIIVKVRCLGIFTTLNLVLRYVCAAESLAPCLCFNSICSTFYIWYCLSLIPIESVL